MTVSAAEYHDSFFTIVGVALLVGWWQVMLVLAASAMVWITTSHRTQKKGLPILHQFINWSLAGLS
jgi:hypothetical protein